MFGVEGVRGLRKPEQCRTELPAVLYVQTAFTPCWINIERFNKNINVGLLGGNSVVV